MQEYQAKKALKRVGHDRKNRKMDRETNIKILQGEKMSTIYDDVVVEFRYGRVVLVKREPQAYNIIKKIKGYMVGWIKKEEE